MSLGYVVIEWNQASHQPELVDGDIWETHLEAEGNAEFWREVLKESGSGRRERYTVAELVEVDDDL